MKTNLIYLFLFIPLMFFGQQIDISGTVKSTSGEPVIFANIFVKNTSRGATTDFDGKYTLKAAKAELVSGPHHNCKSI